MKKIALCLMLCLGVSVGGCNKVEEKIQEIEKEVKSEGREYGQTYNFTQDEIMNPTFFDLKVNNVQLLDEIEEYVPNVETDVFLVLDVSITNTFSDTDFIPMFDGDFVLRWEGQTGEPLYVEKPFVENQFPEEYNIDKGDTASGLLIYVVPRDIKSFVFDYLEYWDDEFEGNSYLMSINV